MNIAPTPAADSPLIKHYGPLVGTLLHNRNINTLEGADQFLNPDFKENHDPFLLYGVSQAVDRIQHAIKNKEKITIYADYDADGIPGAVTLKSFFNKLGYENVDIYIPHRHDEGYGIHIPALTKIIDAGTQLIITIDVGITAHDAGAFMEKQSADLIITDHHLPLYEKGTEQLPKCHTLINPKQSTCNYPDSMLCGCGVIFKLIQGFLEKHREEYSIHVGWEKWLLDMVGIATISDLVPLVNENRIFAYYGMKVLQAVMKQPEKRPGLQKLAWASGLHPRYFTEEDIAFSVTPKINAASRMSHPVEALDVFLATNEADGATASKHLDKLNKERKKLVATTMNEATALLEGHTPDAVVVIGADHWQAGILGLVASKLSEHYKLPSFVWSKEGDEIKGSCRSNGKVHLVELMSHAPKASFIGFGGHKEAGGFSCEITEVNKLEKRLNTTLNKNTDACTTADSSQKLIDMDITAEHISTANYQQLRRLAPFGMGNPKPLFRIPQTIIHGIRNFGKEKNHLEIFIKNDFGKEIRGIQFFATTESYPDIKPGGIHDVICHIEYSVFMGKHELRLKVIDII